MSSATSNGRRTRRASRCILGVWLMLLALAACQSPGSTLPVVKVGLMAPFEGRHRDFGYDVYFAALLAVRAWNEQSRVNGWGVELVAVDDGLDATQATAAAGKLAVDRDIVAVIGPFSNATGEAASPILATGIPVLVFAPLPEERLHAHRPWLFRIAAPSAAAGGSAGWAGSTLATGLPTATMPDDGFAAAYRSAAGREAGMHAWLVYDVTQALLHALADSIRQHGRPTRAGLADALSRTRWQGRTATIQFHADGSVSGLPAAFFATPSEP